MLKTANMTATSHFLYTAIVALALVTAPADAAYLSVQSDEVVSSSVSYSDLDLSREEDVARLTRRVEMKARRFCRNFNSIYATPKMLRECEMQIIAENRLKIERAVASSGR